jgi:hypothetical protein
MAQLTTDKKILFGSTIALLDKIKILGDTANSSPLALLNTLLLAQNYAIAQYENGNDDYYNKVIKLKKLIKDLKSQCVEICNFKERYVAPEICTVDTP